MMRLCTREKKANGEARRHRVVASAAMLAALAVATGCRQDMHDQPKFYPQRSTTFYADGRSVRPQVQGTVARSQGEPADYFHTGMIDGKEADGLPIPLTMDTVARGQERYNVYCAPCHSRVGDGAGRIVQRGYYPAANFHTTRLREAPLGHFFQVITAGYGAMPNYAAELVPEDRWAIAAYIRALQLSQNAKAEDAPAGTHAEPLQALAANQGYAPGLVEQWFPPERPHASFLAKAPAPTPAAPVPPVAITSASQPAAPAKAATEVVAKGTPATAATKAAAGPVTTVAKGTTPAPAAPVAPAPAAAVHDVSAGQSVYMHNCAACHQISRAGMPPNIPSLVGIVPKVGEARIRAVVADGIPSGKPPMPAFSSRLSQEDVDNLLAFLQASK